MSVPVLPLTNVTIMLCVPTLPEASTVHVTKDTQEMDSVAMVNFYTVHSYIAYSDLYTL